MNEIKKNREKYKNREREAYELSYRVYLRMSKGFKMHYIPLLHTI